MTEPGRARRWWHRQLSLRTAALLIAAAGAWMSVLVNRRESERLASRIATMRPLVRELRVDDPGKIAAVKLDELWYDENQWGLYLPAGKYRLCLATRGIDVDGTAPVAASVPMGAGRHTLSLEQSRTETGWRIVATYGTGRLTAEEPAGWNPQTLSVGGGFYEKSTQFAPDQPVTLFRRRFSRSKGPGPLNDPQGPVEGVLLWVERDGPGTGPH